MPLLTIGIYAADGLLLPSSHLEIAMSALRKPSSRRQSATLGRALLHQLENDQDFVDRWLRMHRGRRPIVAVRLRIVTWSQTGQPSRRFVWELCKWPKGDSFEWMFVCLLAARRGGDVVEGVSVEAGGAGVFWAGSRGGDGSQVVAPCQRRREAGFLKAERS